MEDSVPRNTRANVEDSQIEWLDHKRVQILCNDEATINTLFDAYTGFVKIQKKGIFDSFNHEPLDDNVNNSRSPPSAVVHNEAISRVWTPQHRYIEILSQRLSSASNSTIFETVTRHSHCQVTFTKETVKLLDQLADSLYIQTLPSQVYNLLSPEGQTRVQFQLTAIAQDEVDIQRSTTQILKSSVSSLHFPPISELHIIILVQKGKGVVTRPKQNHSSSSSSNNNSKKNGNARILQAVMYLPEFKPLGEQSRADLCLEEQPVKKSAPQTVEEWIERMPYTQSDPFQPPKMTTATKDLSALSDPFDRADSCEVAVQPLKKRFAKGRRAPILLGEEDTIEVNEVNLPQADERTSSPKASIGIGIQHGISSSSKALSLNSIQKSRSTGLLSATPTTKTSVLEDLLNDPGTAITYPVLVPLPAINGPYLGAPSPVAKEPSQAQSSTSQPTWFNHTARASTKSKGRSLLISHEVPPPLRSFSYLDAAMQGSMAVGNLPQEPTGNVCDKIYQTSTTNQRNQSHKGSDPRQPDEPQLERVTVSQVGHMALSKDLDQLMLRLLQSANTLGRKVQVQVDIGRIFVCRRTEPVKIFHDWPSIYNGRKTIETLFTERLPKPDDSSRFPAYLRQLNGQRMFAESPSSRDVKYHFCCETRSGDEQVILQVDESGNVEITKLPHEVGAIQLHFPKHQWDARSLVKSTGQIHNYQRAAENVRKTISVVPSSDRRTIDSLTADLGESGLVFRSAKVLRQICFHSVEDEDISMSCIEVQKFGSLKERQRYHGRQKDRKAAENDGELWWEIGLHSASITSRLHQDNDDSLGVPSPWKPETIIEGGVIGKLHAFAARLVPQLDSLGVTVDQPAKAASSAAFLLEPRVMSVSQPSGFW
ncbi:MAG: hypothetical protein Q9220_003264 [cf. Caloplaca sp. 1 TL-2023]